jgi:hypothetical protein
MSQQIVKTICLQTQDATERDDSSFTFDLKIDEPSFKAVKVALGSLEFPMVQYSIEEDWSRLYFSEGIELDNTNNVFDIEIIDLENYCIRIPQRLNEIQSWTNSGSRVVAECSDPHCLNLIRNYAWGDVEIIASPFGRTSLRDYYLLGTLDVISETKFSIPNNLSENGILGGNALYPNAGSLYIPTIPGPEYLCALLNEACSGLENISLSFKYNDVKIVVEVKNKNNFKIRIKWSLSNLAQFIGIGITDMSLEPRERKTIPTTEFRGWDYVAISPGWYAPSHRPLCTGPPLKFSQEVENAFNRLYFQLPSQVQTGQITSHFLVFSDPCGNTHLCQIPCGKYTPDTLCTHLETEMTKLALTSMQGVLFTVYYQNDRFTFSCEVKNNNGIVSTAEFSLLFNHPLQFDTTKIGFLPQPLIGMESYTSSELVHFPYTDSFFYGLNGKAPKNVYRVSEIGHQKRFVFHAATAPVLTGLIESYNNDQSILKVKTYLAQLPYSHGYRMGDVVKLAASKTTKYYEYDNIQGIWAEAEAEPCPLTAQWGRTAVVLQVEGDATGDFSTCILHLRVRQASALGSCIGKVLQIHSQSEPFNLCFTIPKSIKSNILGFSKKCVLWGRDGSVDSNGESVPPFAAPGVHSLDHPDYVLMTMDESKSNSLQHTSGDQNKSLFAKIVLYPLAREMGMLPRDVSLVGGSNLNRMRFRFFNPDGSPYHFHGSDFSFSLNLVKLLE